MSKIKIWGWEKKERTLLRFIKPGDIFCFKFNEHMYCFGRIIARSLGGHIAEIFDYTSSDAVIGKEDIENASRMMPLMELSSYDLFDYKTGQGDWRIIGHQEDYNPKEVENIYFTFGGVERKKMDVYGNITPISDEEASKYIPLHSWFDINCKMGVAKCLGIEYKKDTQEEIAKGTQEDAEGNGINKNDYVTFFKDDERVEICIDVGNEKVMEVGEKISATNEDAYMNGYNWDALFSCYLEKDEPDILKEMETDPEADMYVAFYPLTPENESRAERFVEIIRSLIEQEDKLCQFVKEEGDKIEWD